MASSSLSDCSWPELSLTVSPLIDLRSVLRYKLSVNNVYRSLHIDWFELSEQSISTRLLY